MNGQFADWNGRFAYYGEAGRPALPKSQMNGILVGRDVPVAPNGWPRKEDGNELSMRWLHSDVKNVAYYYTHMLFRRIVEIGDLR